MVAMAEGAVTGIVGFGTIVRTVYASKRWLALSILVCTGLSTTVAIFMTPVYRSTAVLVPAGPDRGLGGAGATLGQLSGLASLAGISLSGRDGNVEEALAVLTSRQFLERFISDYRLLPKLFPPSWGASLRRRITVDEDTPTLAQAYKVFSQNLLSVTQDRRTGLVSVSVDWKDREEGASWVNELVRRVNEEMRSRAISSANASTAFLERERTTTEYVETREVINRLIEGQIRQRMLATVSTEYAFRVVDRALPADKKEPLRPRKLRLIALGFLAGLAGGCLAILSIPPRSQRSSAPRGA